MEKTITHDIRRHVYISLSEKLQYTSDPPQVVFYIDNTYRPSHSESYSSSMVAGGAGHMAFFLFSCQVFEKDSMGTHSFRVLLSFCVHVCGHAVRLPFCAKKHYRFG